MIGYQVAMVRADSMGVLADTAAVPGWYQHERGEWAGFKPQAVVGDQTTGRPLPSDSRP